jgi:cytochrome c-type biogenesis protein CcmH
MGRVQWLVMGLIVVAALFIGGRGDGTPATAAERTERIARTVRCPTCEGLSVAESDAPASRAIRDDIARRIDEGQRDGDVRAFLVSRYGRDILLKPESRGVAGLVWALPVAGAVLAVAGLVAAFRRWGRRVALDPTDGDRVLVARARLRP